MLLARPVLLSGWAQTQQPGGHSFAGFSDQMAHCPVSHFLDFPLPNFFLPFEEPLPKLGVNNFCLIWVIQKANAYLSCTRPLKYKSKQFDCFNLYIMLLTLSPRHGHRTLQKLSEQRGSYWIAGNTPPSNETLDFKCQRKVVGVN